MPQFFDDRLYRQLEEIERITRPIDELQRLAKTMTETSGIARFAEEMARPRQALNIIHF
jgi:predicted chitinase